MSALDGLFWTVAEEIGMPVCIHALLRSREERLLVRELSEAEADVRVQDWPSLSSRAGSVPEPLEFHTRLSNPRLGMGRAASVLATLLTSGLFDAYPRLRVALIETWVGWIPRLLEAVDDVWSRSRKLMNIPLRRQPSEYWYSNIAASFLDDRYGVALREFVGVENMMWSSDYPHFCTKWPRSREVAAASLTSVPKGEARLILGENCRRFFDLR